MRFLIALIALVTAAMVTMPSEVCEAEDQGGGRDPTPQAP